MYQTINLQKFNIIKSSKSKGEMTVKESHYQECQNSDEVLNLLKSLEREYQNNPRYELLHGVKDRLSICIRDVMTDEEICFYSTDELNIPI